jgi:hypothetical protein
LSASTGIVCSGCGARREVKPTARGTPRLPRGWKRTEESAYCKDCWSGRYVLRTVVVPVAEPISADWPVFRKALDASWSASTELANWAMTEMAKSDCARSAGDTKLPPMPPVYLYPGARERCPDMPPASVVALLHTVEARYRQVRFDVVWRGAAVLPRYRYPMPFPVPSQAWRFHWGNGPHPVPLLELRLSGQSFTLRLRSGPGFRRPMALLEQVVRGECKPGELTLYRQRIGGDSGQTVEDRAPGGGERCRYRVMVRMAAWFPRAAPARRDGVLVLRTAPDLFWRAEVSGRQPWCLNGDHVRRWVAEHRRFLDRMAEDSKAERRAAIRPLRMLQEARARRCLKFRNRLHSWCHQAAASLAGYAARQRVAQVDYLDDDRSYLPSFPWYQLREMLRVKLDALGIVLRSAEKGDSSPVTAEQGREPFEEPCIVGET